MGGAVHVSGSPLKVDQLGLNPKPLPGTLTMPVSHTGGPRQHCTNGLTWAHALMYEFKEIKCSNLD